MAATLRILLIEDDPGDAGLVEREVRRADLYCTFRRVETEAALMAALRDFRPDIVLTDHSLPGFGGRAAMQILNEHSPGTPMIVVTGALGEESAVEYLQAGAADYVTKEHLERLGPALLRALDVKRGRDEQIRTVKLQTATYRIARAAMSAPGLDELFPAVHAIIQELMSTGSFFVALQDPATNALSFPYFVQQREGVPAVDRRIHGRTAGKSLTGEVLRTRQPLLATPEIRRDLVAQGVLDAAGGDAVDWLGVPLAVGDRVIGVLGVESDSRDVRLGEREKEVLQFVSTQIAMAIERSRAVAELRSSELRGKAIIDAALDAVITIDGDGAIRSWSPQAERVFGWPATEAIGETLQATIIPARYHQGHLEGLGHFLTTGEGPILNRRIEVTGRHRDGHEIPLELTVTPVRVENAWLFSAFVRDISERKQVERRRAAQYAVTRALAEAATLAEAGRGVLEAICESFDWQWGALWIVDSSRDALRCIAVWHMPGLELGEFERETRAATFARDVGLPGQVWVSGQPRWETDVTTLSGPRFPRLPQALATGLHGALVFPIRNGSEITGVLECFSRELREPDADLLDLAAALGSQIGQFIERKRAEDALRESETTYRSLVETSPYGIFRSTLDGRLLAVNPALVSMLGYASEAELLDKRLTSDILAVPEDRDRLLDAVVMTGSVTHESVWKRKDGRRITVRQTGRVARQADGSVAHFTVVVEDITQHRLLEDQLRQAQKMEAVGRLAGGVAHDFNNLLTAILGSNDLLLETLPPNHPGAADALETRKAALRAADLTRQLLAFSRQQVLAPRVLSINGVVADMDRMLRRLIGEDVDLRTILAADVGAVRADLGQLEQVILNLAVNARDAMPQGGKLTIETSNVDLDEAYGAAHAAVQPGPYVSLAVSDTGSGMDVATQARIFEPFFTTKPKGKGTGLGLATVYGIVKQSGGHISVDTEPDRGTSFKIYLPRVAAAVEAAEAPQPGGASLRGSETVLLVEDQEEVRRLTSRLLEARGYRVLVAADGHEALSMAESLAGPLHLLVTDVVMPHLSGREVALLLAPQHPAMRVLYLSGYADESIVRHGVLEPGVAFLQKPFTADALARKVRAVLDAEDSGDRTATRSSA
jgi:PAS domain S-box-containing protein